MVGLDPFAEELWIAAINDPALTADERTALIRDLGEAGFPDPKSQGAADLPLIESRLELIELLIPDSMDDANAAAFAEAYKTLVDMHDRLSRKP